MLFGLGRWQRAALHGGSVALVVLLIGNGCAGRRRAVRPDVARPNFLLIVVDALRADALGCYRKAPPGATPVLDSLAARGLRFERAYSPAAWTKPAIASLLTGLYPRQHRCLHGLLEDAGHGTVDGLDPRLVTLAQRLRAAGYATAMVQTNPHVHARFGFGRGFDRSVDLSYLDDHRVVRAAGELLEELPRPFFIYLHFLAPHVPYKPHRDGPFPPLAGRYADRDGFTDADLARCRSAPAPELLAELRQLYRGEVFYADQQIGNVLAALHGLGLSETTVVVATADHGEEFGEHGGLEHGHSLYPEIVRVPLILAGPSIPRGRVSLRVASLIDILPTVLDLADLSPEPNLPGRSLSFWFAPQRERRLLAEAVLWGPPQEALLEAPYEWIRGPREVLASLNGAEIPARGAGQIAQRLDAGLDRMLTTLRPRLRAAPQQRIDPELIEHLHSLGYLR